MLVQTYFINVENVDLSERVHLNNFTEMDTIYYEFIKLIKKNQANFRRSTSEHGWC